MRVFRHMVLLVIFAIFLVGCKKSEPGVLPTLPGGTGFQNMGLNPSPIANKGYFTVQDDTGKTFRAYFAQGIDGTKSSESAKTSFGWVTVKFVDSKTIHVGTTKGETKIYKFSTALLPAVGFTEDIFKEVGGNGVLHLTSFLLGGRWGELDASYSGSQFGVGNSFQFGHVADPKILSGFAQFTGSQSELFLAETNGPQNYLYFTGTSDLTANFNTGKITGHVFEGAYAGTDAPPYYIRADIAADISGNQFADNNMTVQFSNPANFWGGGTGQVAGEFIGDSSTLSVAGAFGGTLSGNYNPGGRTQNFTFSGTFRENCTFNGGPLC